MTLKAVQNTEEPQVDVGKEALLVRLWGLCQHELQLENELEEQKEAMKSFKDAINQVRDKKAELLHQLKTGQLLLNW